jgi:hypothetical protein
MQLRFALPFLTHSLKKNTCVKVSAVHLSAFPHPMIPESVNGFAHYVTFLSFVMVAVTFKFLVKVGQA